MTPTGPTPAGAAAPAAKGVFFFLNLLLAAGALLTLLLALYSAASAPAAAGAGAALAGKALLVLCAAGLYFALACYAGPRGNAVLFAAAAAALLLPELYFAFAPAGLRKHIYNPNYLQHPAPHVTFLNKPDITVDQAAEDGSPTQIRLNGLGLRIERPFERAKPAGEFRVLMLGGSTVFEGFPLAKSIAGRLEALAAADGHTGVKVYNCGVVGYNSAQELALLVHALADYAPDLVIVYDGGNDVTSPYLYDPRPGYPLNYLVVESGYQAVEKRLRPDRLFALAAANVGVVRALFRTQLVQHLVPLAGLRREAGYGTPAWREAALDAYGANLDKLCRLSGGFGFKLAVFLQPLVFTKPVLDESELKYAGPPAFAEHVRAQYPGARRRVADLKRRREKRGAVSVEDLSGVFDGRKDPAFRDFIHLNDAAKDLVARRIYARLKADGLLPPR